MKNTKPIDVRLDQLGESLRNRPSIEADVMSRIQPVSRPRKGLSVVSLRGVGAIATAACVLFVLGVWATRPSSLYAQTLEALQAVKTIHVTGWTSRVVRKWPLESTSDHESQSNIPVDSWYWYHDSEPMSLENLGPVTVSRDGRQLEEYQSDTDLLFVANVEPKDYVDRFSTMTEYLKLLKSENGNSKPKDIGTRTEDGHLLHGVRIDRAGGPVEFWFDSVTKLPIKYVKLKDDKDDSSLTFELNFEYDQHVPELVQSFDPPETKHVRYGSGRDEQTLVWNRHVNEIESRLAQDSIAGPAAVLLRQPERTFTYQYTKQTPDGGHWVLPLDQDQYSKLTVRNFIKLRVQTESGERAAPLWRVTPDLLDIEFPRSDLVYADGTPWQTWMQHALAHIDLEYIDVQETRTFWIARQDGRQLSDWRKVHPPVPYVVEGGKTMRGVVRPGIGHRLSPTTMHALFSDFNWMQNRDYNASHPIIVDETNLPQPPEWDRQEYKTWKEFSESVNYDKHYVASDSPWFAGTESRQMARAWYEKEFGVTFHEEKREVTIHVVRRKR